MFQFCLKTPHFHLKNIFTHCDTEINLKYCNELTFFKYLPEILRLTAHKGSACQQFFGCQKNLEIHAFHLAP